MYIYGIKFDGGERPATIGIKMIDLKIRIKGMPSPRPRFALGRTYMPSEYVQFKKTLKSYFKAFKPFGIVPLRLELLFVFKTPKNVKKNKYPMVRYDVDNLAKSVMDAMEGELMENDCIVTELEVKKLYGHDDYIFITLKEV